MLTEKSTERKSQPQMKKKGTALLTGFSLYLGTRRKPEFGSAASVFPDVLKAFP